MQWKYVYLLLNQLYDLCHHAVSCSPPCENGGHCVAPNLCSCPIGWRGPTCSQGTYTLLFAAMNTFCRLILYNNSEQDSCWIFTQLYARLIAYMAHAHQVLSSVTAMMDGKEINVSEVWCFRCLYLETFVYNICYCSTILPSTTTPLSLTNLYHFFIYGTGHNNDCFALQLQPDPIWGLQLTLIFSCRDSSTKITEIRYSMCRQR